MPSGNPNDKPQKPKSSGFSSANNLLPNKNIWNTTTYQPGHARGPSLNSKESTDNGANVIHANNDASVWPGYPWNDESARSPNTSPNRTRDGGLPRGSAFGNGADSHSAVGFKNGLNGAKNGFQDGSMSRQKRPSRDTSYLESLGSFSSSRDPGAQPPRQSQPSQGYPDLYNGRSHGHTHSNSFQSQRPMSNSSVSLTHKAANSRAFNINKQIDEELPMAFNRHVAVDHGASGSGIMEQPPQSFQFNPGSQPFGDTGGSRLANGHDVQVDSLTNKFSAMKRPSVDRASPAPSSYRLDTSNSPSAYAPPSDIWTSRSSSRDPRTTDAERRGSTQSFAPTYAHPFYPTQYPYPNMGQPFAPNYGDAYHQGFRHHMLPNFPMSFPAGYPLGGTIPPIRPAADHDPTRSLRSAVLEEYKNNKNKKWDLKDFYNHMVEFSGDQHGSRFIQMKLETANSDEKDQVFREIEPNAMQLMKDVFGNYVVQKFFEHGNQMQKKMLAEKIKSKMVDLSLQVYACRVVQKALEHVLVEQQLELVKELQPETVRVMTDQNGNHVIQKIIGLLDRKHLGFMMNALRGQVMVLSNHQYGCRVVQRMMDFGTEDDNDAIIAELRPSAHLLLPDQYGNYVAQHIIVRGKFEDRLRMVSLVLDQLVDLCKHKFASNVVETCIIHGVPELRTMIRQRFEQVGSDGTSVLQQLMRDSYGNYVIQKMATFLTGDEQTAFVEQIKPLFYTLKKNGNSRQIIAMEKMLDLHSRGELTPDAKQYGELAPVAPAPGVTKPSDVQSNPAARGLGTVDGAGAAMDGAANGSQ